MTIPPHGGRLVDRFEAIADEAEIGLRLDGLPTVELGAFERSDLELIACGAFSPLEGFMTRGDYHGVVGSMRLASGLPWTLPVTLPVDAARLGGIREGTRVALAAGGMRLGAMEVREIYPWDRHREAALVYGTADEKHPGVARLMSLGDRLLGGPVTLFRAPPGDAFSDLRLTPAETRERFRRQGWNRVAGFQTRNPIHRAHEYLQKCALEVVDGLLIHPLVGETKEGDTPADVRVRCYRALLENYYPSGRVLLSVFPAAMRYAGPREAVFHAIVRKNYGCTHFIVGRDHAGVGDYYGSFDAHAIFDRFDAGELGVTPLFFDNAFHCDRCGGMATAKTCPHDQRHHRALSGTLLRAMLRDGLAPPPELTRPEVAAVLLEAARHE
jgi:sulfate adenylyltransferase